MTERDWTDRPLAEAAHEICAGVRIERLAPGHQLVVSGDLDAAIGVIAPSAQMAGLMGEVEEPAAIRVARDRAVLIGAEQFNVQPGWDARGFAISDAGQLWAGFALRGDGVMAVLGQGTGAKLGAGSPSAAVRFAGRTALLVRRGDETLIWVEAGMATYLTGWLRKAALAQV